MTQNRRWQLRLSKFSQAQAFLEEALTIDSPTKLERAGIIQAFEMAYELSWKTVKDYAFEQGLPVDSPRQAFKAAFEFGLVQDGHLWMKLLEDRNLTTHTYNEDTAKAIEAIIRDTYCASLRELERNLRERD